MSSVTNEKNCYCHACHKWFHYLGIARHRTMHKEKQEGYKITYTNGEVSTYEPPLSPHTADKTEDE